MSSDSIETSNTMWLGVAGVLMACLGATVYVAFRSKKFCFRSVSECWCCAKTSSIITTASIGGDTSGGGARRRRLFNTASHKRRISKELVNAFSYEDELDGSTSECDEDDDDDDGDEDGDGGDIRNRHHRLLSQQNRLLGFKYDNNCGYQDDNVDDDIADEGGEWRSLRHEHRYPNQRRQASAYHHRERHYRYDREAANYDRLTDDDVRHAYYQHEDDDDSKRDMFDHVRHPSLSAPASNSSSFECQNASSGGGVVVNRRAIALARLQRQTSVCHDDQETTASDVSSYDDHMSTLMLLSNHNKRISTQSSQQQPQRTTNVLKQQAIFASLALKNNSKIKLQKLMSNSSSKDDGSGGSLTGVMAASSGNGGGAKSLSSGKDLISLAEKGRIGKQTSTEGSASSETGSSIATRADHRPFISTVTTTITTTTTTSSSNKPNMSTIAGISSAILNAPNRKHLLRRFKTASSETNDSTKEMNEHKYQMLNSYLDNNSASNGALMMQYHDGDIHSAAAVAGVADESDSHSCNLPDFAANASSVVDASVIDGKHHVATMMAKCGRLEISFAYDAPTKRLCVTVLQAADIPATYQHHHNGHYHNNHLYLHYQHQHHRHHRQASPPVAASLHQVFVQVILLPHKKTKYKTKSHPAFYAVFNETFTFARINPDEIMNLGLRFRLYSVGVSRKSLVIGECRLQFAYMKPQQQETKLWFSLEVPAKRAFAADLRSEVASLSRTDSTSSTSLHYTLPELLLGLSYNGTTGALHVSVLKGSQFRGKSLNRSPENTFMKISLVSSSGQEIAHCKTGVCKGQPNPNFKETFIFQVPLFQLPDVTLIMLAYTLSTYTKRKELIGVLQIGCNSTGDEEMSHWNDMRDSKGEQVSRWHVLHQLKT